MSAGVTGMSEGQLPPNPALCRSGSTLRLIVAAAPSGRCPARRNALAPCPGPEIGDRVKPTGMRQVRLSTVTKVL